ncbi:MAG: branched-chain amino acid ABC transporter permease [Thermoleophilia bacterium]|nr:branched-chain amino acid ABC transporter permease [Thermoleophilia bacterium]
MSAFMQTLVWGIFAGAIYGIAAMGLALVFGVLKILNIAHGELVMLGGYVGFWAFTALGWDPFLSLIIVIPAIFVLGIILDRIIYRHLNRLMGEDKIKNSLLVSFGLGLVLTNLAQWLFTGDERSVQPSYAGQGLNVYGVLLPYTRLATLGIVLVVTIALHLFLRKTYPGKAILATAEDYESAELAGININRVYMLTFALSAGLAAIAGQFVTFTYALAPSIGMYWTLKAMIVIVLAGTGSVLGALPAGILLGIVEALSGAYLSQTYKEVVGLVIFLLVLILRPQGLFVRK